MNRLEQVLIEIEQQTMPVLIVSHVSVLQVRPHAAAPSASARVCTPPLFLEAHSAAALPCPSRIRAVPSPHVPRLRRSLSCAAPATHAQPAPPAALARLSRRARSYSVTFATCP